MRKIKVATGSGEYAVCIGSGLVDSLSSRLNKLLGKQKKRIFVLTSPEIWALWGNRFQTSLSSTSFGLEPPVVLFLPQGESHKRFREVERLATEMSSAGADRSSLLIA